MDSRNTLKINETFIELLQQLQKSGEKASMLLDDNGMVRAEGIIDKIELDSAHPSLKMQDGSTIELGKVVAVNGLFLPEYAQC